jgi:hypothetical protein
MVDHQLLFHQLRHKQNITRTVYAPPLHQPRVPVELTMPCEDRKPLDPFDCESVRNCCCCVVAMALTRLSVGVVNRRLTNRRKTAAGQSTGTTTVDKTLPRSPASHEASEHLYITRVLERNRKSCSNFYKQLHILAETE